MKDIEEEQSMELFMTGATGVLGRAAIPHLVDAGHHVRGLARSEQNAALLRRLAVEPVRADLGDAASLRAAIAGCDAVLHLATKIPPSAEATKPAAWRENDRLRGAGTRAVVEAALAVRVSTVLYPSVTLVYPDSGDAWIDATTTPPAPLPHLVSTLEAEATVARFAQTGGRGLILRMGAFYGPDAPSSREMLRLARRGIALLPGPTRAFMASIWIDDAARALVAALERARSGAYDVTDDEPLRRGEYVQALAEAVGRRRLVRPPLALLRLAGGRSHAAMMTRSQRVTNGRTKDATGWAPRVPNARNGLARLAAQMEADGQRRAAARVGA